MQILCSCHVCAPVHETVWQGQDNMSNSSLCTSIINFFLRISIRLYYIYIYTRGTGMQTYDVWSTNHLLWRLPRRPITGRVVGRWWVKGAWLLRSSANEKRRLRRRVSPASVFSLRESEDQVTIIVASGSLVVCMARREGQAVGTTTITPMPAGTTEL